MLKASPIIIVCALLYSATPSFAATIVNGSFETPALTPGSYEVDPTESGVGWTFSSQADGIASQGSPWFSTTPPDGTQAAFLQSYESIGWFSQTITDLTVGDSYAITFSDAARTGYTADEYTVSLGGVVIGDFLPTSESFTAETTASIEATSTSEVLLFQALAAVQNGPVDVDSIIDNVNIVSSTPEPATFWLLVPAFGYLALSRRRHRALK
jgi:hypothetical protein